MRSFALPGLAALAVVGCCLGLPLIVSTVGLAAIALWSGFGLLVTAILVAGVLLVRARSLEHRES